ncbi:hypothetical protein ACFVIM_01505 [Streptomyces sp. NPDC057638]|uniref:hypothetical protein n=1 Tax=Streptomyces sp. NPDC057638 TaxID=3346190 RepID=UPI0036C70C0C
MDVAPDSLPDAQGVAVVSVHDRRVLYAAPAGAYGTPKRGAVRDRLDDLLADRRVAKEPDYMGPVSRYPQALLRSPNPGPFAPGRRPTTEGERVETTRHQKQRARVRRELALQAAGWRTVPATTSPPPPWLPSNQL